MADGVPAGDSAGMALVASGKASTTLLSGAPGAHVKPAPLATQTAAIGIITPPPEIRSIVVRALAAREQRCVLAHAFQPAVRCCARSARV
jgi:hypothetical protein